MSSFCGARFSENLWVIMGFDEGDRAAQQIVLPIDTGSILLALRSS